MPLFLAHRLTDRRELMEDPACDPRKLRNTYTQFRAVNSLVSGWPGIWRRYLRPAANEDRPFTLLDIGFGGGDIPIRLARWAERDGIELAITAIDTDRRALAYVSRLEHPGTIIFREDSLADLLKRGERFDFVTSNHLLHHVPEAALGQLCDETRRLSRLRVVHSDIARGDLAYLSFAALTAPFFHRSFIVADGLLSIRRSMTHRELRRLAPAGWTVARRFPYHQLLLYNHSG